MKYTFPGGAPVFYYYYYYKYVCDYYYYKYVCDYYYMIATTTTTSMYATPWAAGEHTEVPIAIGVVAEK